MFGKGGDIEYVVFVDDQNGVLLLGLVLDFLETVELEVGLIFGHYKNYWST